MIVQMFSTKMAKQRMDFIGLNYREMFQKGYMSFYFAFEIQKLVCLDDIGASRWRMKNRSTTKDLVWPRQLILLPNQSPVFVSNHLEMRLHSHAYHCKNVKLLDWNSRAIPPRPFRCQAFGHSWLHGVRNESVAFPYVLTWKYDKLCRREERSAVLVI